MEGVFDRPPEEDGAVLLKCIEVESDGRWSAVGAAEGVQLTSSKHDTTGGIATKIECAAAIALSGCPVLIAKAGTPAALSAMQAMHRAAGVEDANRLNTQEGKRRRVGQQQMDSWIGTIVKCK